MIHRGPVVIVVAATLAFLVAKSDILYDAALAPAFRAPQSETKGETSPPVRQSLPSRQATPSVRQAPQAPRAAMAGVKVQPATGISPAPRPAPVGVPKSYSARRRAALNSPAQTAGEPVTRTPAASASTFRAGQTALVLPVLEPQQDMGPWEFDQKSDLDAWQVVWKTQGLEVVQDWKEDSPGSARIAALFTRANQAVQFAVTFPAQEAPELTGRVLRARLRVSTGGPEAGAEGGVQLFSQSSDWQWVASSWIELGALRDWSELSLELMPSGDFDPKAVVRVGVQVHSGTGSNFATTEVYVDSFGIEQPGW